MNLLEWDEIARDGLPVELFRVTYEVKRVYMSSDRGGVIFVPVRCRKYSDGFMIWDVYHKGDILGLWGNADYEHWYMMPKTYEEALTHFPAGVKVPE